MTRLDFLTQARLDDEAFVQALARQRVIKRQINMDYSQLRREITCSLKGIKPTQNRGRDTPSALSSHRSRSVASSRRPMTSFVPRRQRKDDNEDMFVVKKVRVRAKRPLTGVSPERRTGKLPQLVTTQRTSRRNGRT